MSDNLIGATTAIFIVSLSIAVSEPVDVAWSTRDGTAKAGTDYQAANGVVSFLPGETQKQIEVIVYGQNVSPTGDKNFFINLMPPTNAVLGTTLIEAVIKVEDEAGVPVTSVIVAQGKRGLKGDPGLSAYEQAVLMGYDGTLEDWMQEQADAAAAAQRASGFAANALSAAIKAENAATAASFLGNIFPTPEAGVDPVTGVGNGAYYNVRSTEDDSFLVEYQNIGGVPTASGKSYPSSAYVQNLSERVEDVSGYVSLPFVQSKTYSLNERVQLDSGDIVKYTVAGNTNDPNVDMTGWVFDSGYADKNQFEFNELQLAINEANAARHTDTVYLVDFMTTPQFKNWVDNPETVDIAPIYQAALNYLTARRTLTANTGLSGYGLGRIKLPKGQLWFSSGVTQNSALGLITEGAGTYATTIVTNFDAGNIFSHQTYVYLEFSNLSFLHKAVGGRAEWTNTLFNLNGSGGGRTLKLNRVTTNGYAKIINFGNAINEDTTVCTECTFRDCKTFLKATNAQAVVNTFNDCSWYGNIDRVFDIVGYGQTLIYSGNIVVSGSVFYLGASTTLWGGSANFTLLNTKFEWWNATTNTNALGTTRIIETADSNSVLAQFKFINSGIAGGSNGGNPTFDIKGPVTIDIEGGGWAGATIGIKGFTLGSMPIPAFIRFKGPRTSPSLPPSYTAGPAGSIALPVIVEDPRGGSSMTYTSNVNNPTMLNVAQVEMSHKNYISNNGRLATGGASNAHTMNTNGQRVCVDSVIIHSASNPLSATVNVYADSAKTVLLATATLPAKASYQRVVISVPADSTTSEGVYVDITPSATGQVSYGYIETITTSF